MKITVPAPFFILLLLIWGCDALSLPPLDDDLPRQKSDVVTCFCDKYNTTTDWIYCEPVLVDLTRQPALESAEMIFSVRTNHNTSKVVAELYDLATERSVPETQVVSNITYTTHSLYTGNIASYLRGENNLVIRFKNTEEEAVGYITDNSRLVLLYK